MSSHADSLSSFIHSNTLEFHLWRTQNEKLHLKNHAGMNFQWDFFLTKKYSDSFTELQAWL